MAINKTNIPLFKIDFNSWELLKDAETGLLKEPVPLDEFHKFEYWKNQFGIPIRQIISKNRASRYADYLNLDTVSLRRRPSYTLGDSAYDDEISKKDYEELCQTALLKHHFNKHINYDTLLPFQTLALTFLRFKETVVIQKLNRIYKVNSVKKQLEETSLLMEETLRPYEKISEYEFYYAVIQALIKQDGDKFLNR